MSVEDKIELGSIDFLSKKWIDANLFICRKVASRIPKKYIIFFLDNK